MGTGKFDRDASRYHSAVYQRKRAVLLGALHASLSPLYLGQLKNLHKQAIVRFDKDLKAGLGKAGYDFGELVSESKGAAREFFESGAKGEQMSQILAVADVFKLINARASCGGDRMGA